MRVVQNKSVWGCVAAAVCLLVLAGITLRPATKSAVPTGANPPSAIAHLQLDRSLKILYAGRPGSDREKDFVAFLKKYFDVVRTGNLETFKEADTQGFGVTLLDWDANTFNGPRPRVSEGFTRPVMTLGVAGGMICRQWRLKTGYL
jgi:hypothetical protein